MAEHYQSNTSRSGAPVNSPVASHNALNLLGSSPNNAIAQGPLSTSYTGIGSNTQSNDSSGVRLPSRSEIRIRRKRAPNSNAHDDHGDLKDLAERIKPGDGLNLTDWEILLLLRLSVKERHKRASKVYSGRGTFLAKYKHLSREKVPQALLDQVALPRHRVPEFRDSRYGPPRAAQRVQTAKYRPASAPRSAPSNGPISQHTVIQPAYEATPVAQNNSVQNSESPQLYVAQRQNAIEPSLQVHSGIDSDRGSEQYQGPEQYQGSEQYQGPQQVVNDVPSYYSGEPNRAFVAARSASPVHQSASADYSGYPYPGAFTQTPGNTHQNSYGGPQVIASHASLHFQGFQHSFSDSRQNYYSSAAQAMNQSQSHNYQLPRTPQSNVQSEQEVRQPAGIEQDIDIDNWSGVALPNPVRSYLIGMGARDREIDSQAVDEMNYLLSKPNFRAYLGVA